MTWEEFKAKVDEELNGDNPEILFIDTYASDSEIYIELQEGKYLKIT